MNEKSNGWPVPTSNWLFPEEYSWVVKKLYEFGVLKFSNKRDLPLKKGGTTDIYINLRDARNNPEAIDFIARLFQIPLQRIKPNRFVEIPDSVSCFCGPLSIYSGIPYLTIREQAKEGRATNSKIIGTPNKGEEVCIIDDVITDGASKIIPQQECLRLGLNNLSLIVLVDREQGWQELLAKENISMNVWAGMTLHDVRRQLIETGLMQRCSPENEQKNPLVVALDGKNWNQMLPIIDQLRTTGCILKVNDLLFGEGIYKLLPNLSVYGRVMADLKCHDIPNTVTNTCNRLKTCPPWAVTVHSSGGDGMIEAAVKTLKETSTMVLAVTVLTSIDENTGEEIYSRKPWEQVLKLAEIAQRSGAHGLVCSPEELPKLKGMFPGLKLATPGLRSLGANQHDQKRIDTPASAKNNGSDYLIMGRQIFEAADPVAEVYRILKEELGIVID
jgi:orotidine-5'-phosphate decarboxylase